MLSDDKEISEAFDKMSKARSELVQLLREKAHSKVETEYTFVGADGSDVSLRDLFGDRKDLLVVHNMGRQCRWCTLWADGLNGLHDHINARTRIVLVSPDSPEVQKEFSSGREWTIPMVSDRDGTFTSDMGFAVVQDCKRYVLPGVSSFHMNDDDTIVRVAADGFGPGDVYMPVYPLFELLHDGASTWEPQYTYPRPQSIEV
jgi:predicted dithiol-disulfide oxidoreductase (DUF899 family)